MFKKIVQTIANAGTVALLGYEIGSGISKEEKREEQTIKELPKIITESHNHSEIIIFGIVLIIIAFIIILIRAFWKKRPLV